jgi:hypothetical protein
MQEASMENDLVRKTLRSVGMKRETIEEIQTRYTALYPPSFLFKAKPSIDLRNLKWALNYLVECEYVAEEVTRFLDYELDEDKKVYSLTQKGLASTLKKKK